MLSIMTDFVKYEKATYIGITAGGRRPATEARYPPHLWNQFEAARSSEPRRINTEAWHKRFQNIAFVMDVIKMEPGSDPMGIQTSGIADIEEKNPLSEEENLLDLDVTKIKTDYIDHGYDMKSEIVFEESAVPIDFPMLKSEAGEEFCELDQVKEVKLEVTAEENEVSTERFGLAVIMGFVYSSEGRIIVPLHPPFYPSLSTMSTSLLVLLHDYVDVDVVCPCLLWSLSMSSLELHKMQYQRLTDNNLFIGTKTLDPSCVVLHVNLLICTRFHSKALTYSYLRHIRYESRICQRWRFLAASTLELLRVGTSDNHLTVTKSDDYKLDLNDIVERILWNQVAYNGMHAYILERSFVYSRGRIELKDREREEKLKKAREFGAEKTEYITPSLFATCLSVVSLLH
ncbi:hypothetical protein ANN_27564 [Periplaneta americana]|uniref:Uncharacterized protein n=1 Tax=Periplaneta americana TaxID=6978 RepID=A0ABQ8RW27_PERAM|nr:hypothetical protein ANN_27564 [Periplaneta americana]